MLSNRNNSNNRTIDTIGINKVNYNSNNRTIDPIEADAVITEYRDLIHPDYQKWHYKALYAIGVRAYQELAGKAKEGRSPQRLFTSLLQAHMASLQPRKLDGLTK